MSVRVTLEFDDVNAAIAALNNVAGSSAAAPASPPPAAKKTAAKKKGGKSADTAATASADTPPSEADAQAAFTELFNKFGVDPAKELLDKYKAGRVKEVKPEQRKQFIADCAAKVAGE